MLHSKCELLALYTLVSGGLAAQGTIAIYEEKANSARGLAPIWACVPLSPNTIEWSVNGVVGGNARLGTVTQSGLNTAPAEVPNENTVRVVAVTVAYPTMSGSALVTITQPVPDCGTSIRARCVRTKT